MSLLIDNPRVQVMKNGSKSLAFAMTVKDPVSGRPIITIDYFRLMDGRIKSPTSGKRYNDVCWLFEEDAADLYRTLGESGWIERYELPPMLPLKIATATLVLNYDVARLHSPLLIESTTV